MTMSHFLLTAWDWEPSVIVGCAGLLVAYAVAARLKFSKAALCFAAGVLILFLTLVSPLDTLSDIYSFTAHMLQHMLLILVVPPLLLLGIPKEMAKRALRYPWVRRAEEFLSKPLLAWSLGVGALWVWHWPPLYNAALGSEHIHILEHLSFLVGSTIFWWPVISPVEELRLRPLAAVAYTFGACSAHTVLAILLTFAPLGNYPAYINPPDPYGILPIIRGQWGLTPLADQQWGGLLMWVPACLVYLSFILATLARWYRLPEHDVAVAVPSAPAAVQHGGRF
ncbi:MAG TPA: cytochrome c oxidase assembly protein [Terriglobia bacterium]|nr:cytochrome c oxidase assembly protein [Terriglobia bacterium]